MKQYTIIILIVMVVFFSACEKFLSEPPSKTSSLVPSTTEHLEDLLNSYTTYQSEANLDVMFGSDDYGFLEELYYYRFLNNGYWNYIPSPELLAIYDHTCDLRYKCHIVEDYSYDIGLTTSYPGYIFFFKGEIPSGPAVAEMLLIKAECQDRLWQWQNAITTVNLLRVKWMDNTAPANMINLSAISQVDALVKILQERRRELPFTQRFFDVRRYNNNTNPADDVVMTRNFYPVGANVIEVSKGGQTLTLEKNSRKFARPLPITDINTSLGILKQNTY